MKVFVRSIESFEEIISQKKANLRGSFPCDFKCYKKKRVYNYEKDPVETFYKY